MLVDGMTYGAVFFDAGETLVHPHPSFPELLSDLLGREGDRTWIPIDVREGVSIVAEHFARAAEDGVLWTTSAQASKAFWLEVYRAFLARVGAGDRVGLPERLYEAFTDLSNYRLFDDVLPVLHRAQGRAAHPRSHLELRGVARTPPGRAPGGRPVRRPGDLGHRRGREAGYGHLPHRAGARRDGGGPSASMSGTTRSSTPRPLKRSACEGCLIDRRGRFPDHAGPGVRITSLSDLPGAIGLHPPVATAGLA